MPTKVRISSFFVCGFRDLKEEMRVTEMGRKEEVMGTRRGYVEKISSGLGVSNFRPLR